MVFQLQRFREASAFAMALALALLTTSCVMGPRMDVDSSNLGQSPLGQLIAKTWMLPEEMLRGEVTSLLAKQKVQCRASAACLEELGFQNCTQQSGALTCSYSGEVKAVLRKTSEEKVENRVRIQIELNIVDDDTEVLVRKIGSI